MAAVSGEPTECAEEHRADDGGRQARIAAQRHSHGLTAETVIDALEDSEDYRGFEAAITSDYNAETAVERELVLRVVSLLWPLRRIIAIETDLFQIQVEILCDRRNELASVYDELSDKCQIMRRAMKATGSAPAAPPYRRGS